MPPIASLTIWAHRQSISGGNSWTAKKRAAQERVAEVLAAKKRVAEKPAGRIGEPLSGKQLCDSGDRFFANRTLAARFLANPVFNCPLPSCFLISSNV